MTPARFRFRRCWTVAAPVVQTQAVLVDLGRYPEWWPQVVAVAKVDDVTARVLCRSRLPYTLDLELRALRADPAMLKVQIAGDLAGTATFRLSGLGRDTQVSYSQVVTVNRVGLGAAARVLRPVLVKNHDHMMAGCEQGLRARTTHAGGQGA